MGEKQKEIAKCIFNSELMYNVWIIIFTPTEYVKNT